MNSILKRKMHKGRIKIRKLYYTKQETKITIKGTQGIDNILGKT